eukprot:TRINITY_DN10486_c0_g1_i2.p1 TRINITY_DN10486_c0_g1~~TRINITY_DN10486_c0_g1_i2.p1  ORF type:complete len:281 (+),score=41.73 TRINITY_DN10486_c0_g1_i2:27-845(+)
MEPDTRPYTLHPLKLGFEVTDFDLSKVKDPAVIKIIKNDVKEHSLLVFRNQGTLTPEEYLEIGAWFGDIEPPILNHEKAPHKDIFRISNDCSQGMTRAGFSGWHIDGTYHPAPPSHSLYRIVELPTNRAATSFIPFTALLDSLPHEKRKVWDTLWTGTDDAKGIVHPLIYRHPETGKPVMCVHLGLVDHVYQNYGTPQQKDFSTHEFIEDIYEAIVSSDLIYHHEYQTGDLIISDNLALGHIASEETQLPRSQIGLRIMDRINVAGKKGPQK